jgi:ABC-type transporter Mla subunit MlaD
MADDLDETIKQLNGLAEYFDKAANAIESTPSAAPDAAKQVAKKMGINLDGMLKPMNPLFPTKEAAMAGDTSEQDLANAIEKQLDDIIA